VELRDKNGTLCPNATDPVSFTLTGPGTLLAVGSGKPTTLESFQRPVHSAYQGRLLAIVKAGTEPGALTLTATAAGLPPATARITTAPP